jgi:hypothetical protein
MRANQPPALQLLQACRESPFNLLMMRLIDEQCKRTFFFGLHQMAAYFKREGYDLNHKRVDRLMRKISLQAIYPRLRSSIPDQQHKRSPYYLCSRPTLEGLFNPHNLTDSEYVEKILPKFGTSHVNTSR